MKRIACLLAIAASTLMMGSCFWPYDDYYHAPPRPRAEYRSHGGPRHQTPPPPRHTRAPRR